MQCIIMNSHISENPAFLNRLVGENKNRNQDRLEAQLPKRSSVGERVAKNHPAAAAAQQPEILAE